MSNVLLQKLKAYETICNDNRISFSVDLFRLIHEILSYRTICNDQSFPNIGVAKDLAKNLFCRLKSLIRRDLEAIARDIDVYLWEILEHIFVLYKTYLHTFLNQFYLPSEISSQLTSATLQKLSWGIEQCQIMMRRCQGVMKQPTSH